MGGAIPHFHIGRYSEACALVERFHYSHRVPSNVQLVGTWHADGGLFGDAGPAIAACFFTIPPTRWSEDVLELARLVRTEDADVRLTGLIASLAKNIRQKGVADLLVSFADASKGHHGGVYQAASWAYDGQRDRRMDGITLDGGYIGGRACNHKFGTQSPDKLRALMPDRRIEPHFDIGKHLYWRSLCKSGEQKAARLGLKRLPYPKPDHETNRIAA